MRGIFAVDPGVSTGVAWGIFNPKAPTAIDAMLSGLFKGSITATGSEMDQALLLFDLWQTFKADCVRKHLMAPGSVELVIEDFTLFPGAHAGGKEGIAPVRVGWAFEGYRQGRGDKWAREKHVSAAIWQPSSAVATRHMQSLKKCGCWIRGREHERAAFCHILARLKKIIR